MNTVPRVNPGSITRSRLARHCSLAALALACLLASSAAASPSRPSDGNLSPRLAQLTEPALRSASLAQAGKRLSLAARGPGSLLRKGNRVVVEVRFGSGARAAADALRAAGAQILVVSPRYQTVTVAAKPADLRAIGALDRVAAVTEVLSPTIRGADCGGSVTSEGDQQLNAALARKSFGVDGSGVTVGILSDSFNRNPLAVTHAPGDVLSGDLPGPGSPCGSQSPVNVFIDNDPAGQDEGRAMIQIVHDLAPGASVAFAPAAPGILGFAANIRGLANAGATVIADDVGYPEEPFFQDGPVAQAVNEVTAKGVSYLSAAGNDNVIAQGHNIASWEAPAYRDLGPCRFSVITLSEEVEEEEEDEGLTPVGLHPDHCMDFDPSAGVDDTLGFVVEGGGGTIQVDLQWAEPWFGVQTDLDAFLLDNEGGLVRVGGDPVFSAEDNINQKPFEFLSWENTEAADLEVQLQINRFAGPAPGPRFKVEAQGANGLIESEYEVSNGGDVVGPLVYGQPGAASAIAVGAVPYNDSAKPEEFSSPGPVTHYFGPVVGTTPAAAIVPQQIPKPDIAATDGGATTFFSQQEPDKTWRFFGTSAATPHATAVMALMRQANPSASADQLRAALTRTARPVGGFPGVGAGLVDAFAAVKSVALPPQVTITKAPAAFSRERRPTFQFLANRQVNFRCQLQQGAAQPCASPLTVPAALHDGAYSFAVSGVDAAGREGSSSVKFTIDTKAPRTSIVKHPRSFILTHRARFRFRSNERGVKFECKVDRGRFRQCPSNLSRSFRSGRHVIKVRARDAAGNVDRTPAVFHFSVV